MRRTEMEATIKDIKEFFGYTSLAQLRDEWASLTEEEKKYFKEAVGAEIHGK